MDERAYRKLAKKYPDCILLPYAEMAEADGLTALFILTEHFSGSTVYIPSLRRIFRGCIEQELAERYNKGFDKANIRELAKEFGYHEKAVRNLLNK